MSTIFGRGLKQWAVDQELSNTINLTPYLILGCNTNNNKELLLFDRQAFFYLGMQSVQKIIRDMKYRGL